MYNYRDFTVEEFVTDENFRQWIHHPTKENSLFWKNWQIQNPDKISTLQQASELLLSFNDRYKDDLTDETMRNEINKLVELASKSRERTNWFFVNSRFWKIAVMFLLVSGFGWLYIKSNSALQSESELTATAMITKTNRREKEMTVLLSDGSMATLKKGSSLKFPRKFSQGNRIVYLTGEAFFDVTKNPESPFLVYANETITKVLGTSFLVKAFDKDNTVLVVVKTGRVSVFSQKEYESSSKTNKNIVPGVELRPNQQVVYHKNNNHLDMASQKNPAIVMEPSTDQDLSLDDQPLPDVLNTLEKMYGIEIKFDREKLESCTISTTFKEENLIQRMNAICQAIGANYEVIDGQIVLSSKGC